MKTSHALVFFLAMSIGYATAALAHTQGVLETQQLGFGQFAMAGNAAVVSVIMTPSGVQTNPPTIHSFFQGQPGIFQLTDFLPNTALTVSIADIFITNPSGGPNFEIRDFTWDPDPPVTDASANLTLKIGATLRTDGSGILYEDGGYSGTYSLVIAY